MSDLRLRISEGDDTVEDEDGTGGEATSSASSPGIKKTFVANSSLRIMFVKTTSNILLK